MGCFKCYCLYLTLILKFWILIYFQCLYFKRKLTRKRYVLHGKKHSSKGLHTITLTISEFWPEYIQKYLLYIEFKYMRCRGVIA